MTTVRERENEVREMATALHIPISRGQVKRMAWRLIKAEQAGPIEFSQFWLVYNNADPTPATAIRNLERNPK